MINSGIPVVFISVSFLLRLLKSTMFFTGLAVLALHVNGQTSSIMKGKDLFTIHCSRCHGVQGGGGEGPALNRPYLPRATDNETFAAIIEYGIPGTSMPGNWALGPKDITQLIAFVRSLSSVEKGGFTGNAVNGAVIFEKTGCLKCHSVNGKGTSLGPDLKGVGLRRSVSHISEVLVTPAKSKISDMDGFAVYQAVELVTADGTNIKGIRMNEDTYSIQVKDLNNKFYSFRKDKLKSVKRITEESIMPSFSQTLTNEERRDVVAFLLNLK